MKKIKNRQEQPCEKSRVDAGSAGGKMLCPGVSGWEVIRREAGSMIREVLHLLYPVRCPICDEIVQPGELICPECEGRIRIVAEPVCKRCGKILSDERREYCMDCGKMNHSFTQGKAVFVYEGAIRQSMYRFKYSNRREYAEFFSQKAVQMYGEWIHRMGVEVIVPVPMYRGKVRRRGYNQAEVFARSLGEKLRIPVDTSMVVRVRDTRPQKELNDRKRRENLKNAFQFASNIVKYSRILLVDDIYTTGSTMDAVTEVLLAAGIKKVYYICASIGVGY